LLILPQNTLANFGVEVDYQTAYKISEARYEVNVDTVDETFSGYLLDGELQEENTKIIINVESIDTTELTWNTTVNNNTITGACPDVFDGMAFQNFLLSAYFLLQTFDVSTIISSGIVDPEYLDAFYLPLFVSIAPATWTTMEQFSIDQETFLDSIFGLLSIVIEDKGTNWVETSDTVSLEYWYSFNYTIMTPSYIVMNSSTSFSYDKTTGSLLDAEMDNTLSGDFGGYLFIITEKYSIEKTNLPFNLIEFLTENKWYFIGGGAGLGVIAITVIGFRLNAKRKKK